jgi:hypothetical protein
MMGGFQHHHLFVGEQCHRIAAGIAMRRAPVAVAHAGQIHRHDMIIARQEGRDETPPIGMRSIAMHQQDAGLGRIAPAQIMDPCAFDGDELTFRHMADRLAKPAWRGRRRSRQTRKLALVGLQIEQMAFGFR